jgi:rhodanese-related sulfurtransferase
MERMTADQLLAQARAQLTRVTPAEAFEQARMGACLVDTRTGEQIARDGHVPGALEISLNVLEWRLDPASASRHAQGPALDDLVVLLCDQGFSSSLAAARLVSLGFRRATDVVGGFQAWRADGLPVEPQAQQGRPPT